MHASLSDLVALQARYGARYRWLLLSVMIGTMASIMSSTIINVAIPDLSRQFNLGQESAQWVGSGFMLVPAGVALAMTIGAAGVSLCGIVLDWRVSAHGDSLKRLPSSAGRLTAFGESFVLLAAVCVVARVTAWRLRPPRRRAAIEA